MVGFRGGRVVACGRFVVIYVSRKRNLQQDYELLS
jgi:hypothetical protein